MRRKDRGERVLRIAFQRLEREIPKKGADVLQRLRRPEARWVRIPVGVLGIAGGVFSFLPVLGIWMLPLGLLLIAYDVPVLRGPVGGFTIWGTRQWKTVKIRILRLRVRTS